MALTEGLKDNQKAITRGLEQFERLADMKELPQIEDFDDDNKKSYSGLPLNYQSDTKKSDTEQSDTKQSDTEQSDTEQSKKFTALNIEKNFDDYYVFIIEKYGYPRPKDLIKFTNEDINKHLKKVTEKIKILTGKINGRNNKKDPDKSSIDKTESIKFKKDSLQKYERRIFDYFRSIKYKVGEGLAQRGRGIYFSPPRTTKKI